MSGMHTIVTMLTLCGYYYLQLAKGLPARKAHLEAVKTITGDRKSKVASMPFNVRLGTAWSYHCAIIALYHSSVHLRQRYIYLSHRLLCGFVLHRHPFRSVRKAPRVPAVDCTTRASSYFG